MSKAYIGSVKRLAQLRLVSVICVAVALGVVVLLAVERNWLLVGVTVLGCLAWDYGTRHEARWFR